MTVSGDSTHQLLSMALIKFIIIGWYFEDGCSTMLSRSTATTKIEQFAPGMVKHSHLYILLNVFYIFWLPVACHAPSGRLGTKFCVQKVQTIGYSEFPDYSFSCDYATNNAQIILKHFEHPC